MALKMYFKYKDHKNTTTIVIVSIMTAVFVVILQFASSALTRNDDVSKIVDIIDSEGIEGHIIQVEKTGKENIKSDDMLTSEERKEFDKYGYVKIKNGSTGVTSNSSLAIQRLLVDLKESGDLSLFEMGSSDGRGADTHSLGYAAHGHPSFVTICDAANKRKSCNLKLKDSKGSFSDQTLAVSLRESETSSIIVGALNTDASSQGGVASSQKAILEMHIEPF